ncbi:MAG: HlyD family efflux transporter periplasmic adaptor subunit [Acidimicrobiia bacterium]
MHRLSSNKFKIATVAVVVVVALAGIAVAAAGQDPGSGYRTATASFQAVQETLDEVGTIAPVAQATVSFPVAGTVASVDVAAGDSVTAGQVLATLDTASLEANLRTAQAALDRAELTLEQAENGEAVTGGGAGATIPAMTTGGAVTFQLIAATTSVDAELQAAQQAVLDAKKQVDADMLAAHEALESAHQICAALGEPASLDAQATDDSAVDDATACYDALEVALAAQQQLSTSQQALNDAATALDDLLAQRATETSEQESGETPAPTGDTGNTTQPPTNGGTEGGTAPPGNNSAPEAASPSSEDLIAYQAEVDAAALDITVAEQALQQAIVVAPIDGTVVSVDIVAGEDVSAASDEQTISIAGNGGYELTATVSVTDLPDLEIGQVATILPDGTSTTLTGKVVDIGLVATTGTSDTTYPVTISIEGDTAGVRSGSVASVAVVIDEGDDVLSVPTTAIHNDNGNYTVTVLDGDTTETVTVEVGAIGPAWTEIRSGLEEGDVVVIADLDEPLPGSANDGSTGGTQNPFGGFRGPPGLN